MLKLERALSALNEKIGFIASFLILPLVGVVVFEVMMRYGFNAPTVWAFEMTTFLYGMHYMLTLGYAHKYDGHVAIDVFEAKLPQKPRTLLRIITNLVIFIPTIGLFSIWSVIYASTSWQGWERASSSWAPPIYPYKTIMAIGFILLLVQGIAKLIHDIRALRNNE
jgi:TRAP-type mannitol/chloroaromatic compound transport system permease small subunit